VLADVSGTVYPAVWDAEDAFGELHAEVATYLAAPGKLEPTLALRAAGRKVWGTFPFHEAAFVGGRESVRGFSEQRFAGDAAAWGNAELRVFLTDFFLVLPGELGLFALGDAGRVWNPGESSSKWHAAAGGGIWFAFVDRANTITLGVARSGERTGFYIRSGFLF
jgi:hemolysin activation/secretion protein